MLLRGAQGVLDRRVDICCGCQRAQQLLGRISARQPSQLHLQLLQSMARAPSFTTYDCSTVLGRCMGTSAERILGMTCVFSGSLRLRHCQFGEGVILPGILSPRGGVMSSNLIRLAPLGSLLQLQLDASLGHAVQLRLILSPPLLQLLRQPLHPLVGRPRLRMVFSLINSLIATLLPCQSASWLPPRPQAVSCTCDSCCSAVKCNAAPHSFCEIMGTFPDQDAMALSHTWACSNATACLTSFLSASLALACWQSTIELYAFSHMSAVYSVHLVIDDFIRQKHFNCQDALKVDTGRAGKTWTLTLQE